MFLQNNRKLSRVTKKIVAEGVENELAANKSAEITVSSEQMDQIAGSNHV
jgi:hypothetical protein